MVKEGSEHIAYVFYFLSSKPPGGSRGPPGGSTGISKPPKSARVYALKSIFS